MREEFMETNPLVHIILINYNGYEDTVECIESIKKGSYKNYKIVIVDNASPDNSGILIKDKYINDENVHVILNKENNGFSAGNNKGLQYALKDNTDYVLLLNNDTLVETDFLEILVHRAVVKNINALYTGKILYNFDHQKIWFAGGEYNLKKGTATHIGINTLDGINYDKEKRIEFICGCCIFMSRESCLKMGKLPEEYFLYGEDLAYSLEAQRKNIQMFYIPEARVYHKVSSATSKISELAQYYIIRNRFYIIKKYHCGINKIFSMIFSMLWCAKRIKRGEFSIKIVKDALHDFKYSQMGRKNENKN